MCQQAGIRQSVHLHYRRRALFALRGVKPSYNRLEALRDRGAQCIDDEGVHMRDVLPPGRVDSRNLQVRLVSGAAWIGSVSTRWTSPTRLHSLLALLVQKYYTCSARWISAMRLRMVLVSSRKLAYLQIRLVSGAAWIS